MSNRNKTRKNHRRSGVKIHADHITAQHKISKAGSHEGLKPNKPESRLEEDRLSFAELANDLPDHRKINNNDPDLKSAGNEELAELVRKTASDPSKDLEFPVELFEGCEEWDHHKVTPDLTQFIDLGKLDEARQNGGVISRDDLRFPVDATEDSRQVYHMAEELQFPDLDED